MIDKELLQKILDEKQLKISVSDCGPVIEEYLKSADSTLDKCDEVYSNSPDFCRLVHEVLKNNIRDRSETVRRLSQIGAQPYGENFRLLFIDFDHAPSGKAWTFVIRQLEDLYQDSCICVYDRYVMIFAPRKKRDEYRFPAIEAFLKEYGAYLCLGARAKYLSALPGMFYQCKTCLRIARELRENPEERIFIYESYAVYLMVENCLSDHFMDFHGGKYHFYLPQSFLDLIRYDMRNNTDNAKVLRVFLMNNCQISETSRQLFMHRNTLMARLEKVEEILGESLDNNTMRARLMFAFYMKDYIEKYKKSSVFPYGMD